MNSLVMLPSADVLIGNGGGGVCVFVNTVLEFRLGNWLTLTQ